MLATTASMNDFLNQHLPSGESVALAICRAQSYAQRFAAFGSQWVKPKMFCPIHM